MSEPTFDIPSPKTPEKRLDSWKEIAVYLNRDVTTVQRWEKKEGMPVYRHVHDKGGSVSALTGELDAWLEKRRPHVEEDGAGLEAERPRMPEGKSQARSRPGRWFPVRWFVVAILSAGVLAAAYLMLRDHIGGTARPKIRSLAVLPLRNLSSDASQEYLADGMTEALIGRLSEIHNLRVISHTSVMRFKSPQISVPAIAKTLGVDAVVEGSVIRDGSRIRVTAQLIRGATDEHVWSETYDRETQDALSLESEIAQAIAEKVQVTLTGPEQQRLTAARPVAPEVYESYLRGRFAYNEGYSRAEIEASRGYFEDAVRKDPTFAPAYAGLAEVYEGLGTMFVGGRTPEMRPKAMSAVRKALELDPNLAEAHVLLASILQEEWHWTEAEAEYKRALELSPNDADAHAEYGSWLACQARTDEGLAWVQRARELDPEAVSGESVAWSLFLAHRFDEAIREAHDMMAVRPNDATVLLIMGTSLLGKDEAAEAIPVLEKAAAVSKGSPAVEGILIRAYAHAGRRSDALRLLAELERRRKAGYVPADAFVTAYLGLGDKEEAFASLKQAYTEKSNILQFLKVYPFFDPIRSDPRFADLERRVGLG